MRVAVVAGPGGAGLICRLSDSGSAAESAQAVPDLAAAMAELESLGRHGPTSAVHGSTADAGGESAHAATASGVEGDRDGAVRWVWQSARLIYPHLLRAGVRVARCHDLELTEALLRARDGLPGAGLPGPVLPGPGLPGAGLPGPVLPGPGLPGRPPAGAVPAPASGRPAAAVTVPELPFESADVTEADPHAELTALIGMHADQLARIGSDADPRRFALLAAAESAGGLVAAEMTAAGLPWRADVHDRLLTEALGPRPPAASGLTLRPARLAQLAGQITAALGAARPVNPDSPAQLLRALAAAGIRVASTRTAALRTVDHPVIPLLLEYKELARLYTANGWSWLDTWVSGGRFRPEYVVGGVVSGRWASRGGGALQIPRPLRRAVVADRGWTLVVADAAQLEPRILAALAGDRAFAQAAAGGDLYQAVASSIGGERATAKVALLSAMYGGTGGDAGQSLALFRRRFPEASAYVESAARAGEEGRVVRSVLGRTCPPPSADWLSLTSDPADPEQDRAPGAARAARARGRFTRNFVVQASAADWAAVLLAVLRGELARLPAPGPAGDLWQRPHLVFFQHDEVVVHSPAEQAPEVVAAIEAAAGAATRLVFGATEVTFPMTTAVVDCYADAK